MVRQIRGTVRSQIEVPLTAICSHYGTPPVASSYLNSVSVKPRVFH